MRRSLRSRFSLPEWSLLFNQSRWRSTHDAYLWQILEEILLLFSFHDYHVQHYISGQSKSFHQYNTIWIYGLHRIKSPGEYIKYFFRQKISRSDNNPMPQMANDRGNCCLLRSMKKSSITHHADENNMASPT